MGTADGAMGGSYGAREFGAGEWADANWRSGGSRELTEEIVQETWLVAVGRIRRFEPAQVPPELA